jgi:hypothetical protein
MQQSQLPSLLSPNDPEDILRRRDVPARWPLQTLRDTDIEVFADLLRGLGQ